ncbi:MAG: hypothetical protein ACE5SW_11920 [Nitrososphaeraceae archaeon]
MDNSKIRNGTIFIMAAVLVAGTISMIIPSSFAQSYEDPYAKDPYANDNKKSTDVNIQKIKCINENTNVNGIDITEIPQNGIAAAEAQANEDGSANGNGPTNENGNGINFDKNLVNICVNLNFNNQERVPIIGDITTIEQ